MSTATLARSNNTRANNGAAIDFPLILTIIGLIVLLIGGPIALAVGVNWQQAETRTNLSQSTQRINLAVGSGTSVASIAADPAPYTGVVQGMTFTVTPGSCGSTASDAYTLTATGHGSTTIYASKTDRQVSGNTSQQNSLLTEVCKH